MTFRALAGGGSACAYCGFCLVVEGPRQCCPAGRDHDALAARLAEADALIAKGLAVVHDFLPNIGRCVLQDYQRMNEFCSEAAARTAVSAVQPERCCLDYPRCDCNSPPEPDNAPAVLQCGHPASLLLRSAETGEPLYCELCDDKSGRRDAVQCETELRAEVDRLKAALKTVGDDYPGSSCQQWCYEAAGIRAPTLQPCGHPWKAQHDFKCILCSSPGPAHEECLGCSSPTTCEKYGCSVKRQRAIDSASGDRDATSAQLTEEQRFLHGAAADAQQVPEGMALYKGEFVTARMVVERLVEAERLLREARDELAVWEDYGKHAKFNAHAVGNTTYVLRLIDAALASEVTK